MHAVPIILAGTMLDVRDGSGTISSFKPRPVKWEAGNAVAKEIGAYAYFECSAKTGEGVRKVFEVATQAALFPKRRLEHKNLQVKPRLCKLIYIANRFRI
jgi:hypothetical protein